MSPKMVNPRDIAGNAEEEEEISWHAKDGEAWRRYCLMLLSG